MEAISPLNREIQNDHEKLEPAKTLKPSLDIIRLIAYFEGFRDKAYLCPAGIWTIGYGNTFYENGDPVKKGDTITHIRARELFYRTIDKFANRVRRDIGDKPVTQGQFDVMVSLKYNMTANSYAMILSRFNTMSYQNFLLKLMEYNKGGGKVLSGLVKRRFIEVIHGCGYNEKPFMQVYKDLGKSSKFKGFQEIINKDLGSNPKSMLETIQKRKDSFGSIDEESYFNFFN